MGLRNSRREDNISFQASSLTSEDKDEDLLTIDPVTFIRYYVPQATVCAICRKTEGLEPGPQGLSIIPA